MAVGAVDGGFCIAFGELVLAGGTEDLLRLLLALFEGVDTLLVLSVAGRVVVPFTENYGPSKTHDRRGCTAAFYLRRLNCG